MHIIGLKATNVKRIQAVEIEPANQSMVLIKGRNSQGKSSVLDSIMYALAGNKVIPAKPIRDGETSAEVELDLGEYTVKRRWTSNESSTLEVRSKQAGSKFSSPQKLLDSFLGTLTFDPLAFLHYEPKKQSEILKDLVKLDTSSIDEQIQTLYAERTVLNRDIARQEAILPEAPSVVPDQIIDIKALQGQKRDIDNAQQAIKKARASLAQIEAIEEQKKLSEQHNQALQRHTDQHQSLLNKRKEISESIKRYKQYIAALEEQITTIDESIVPHQVQIQTLNTSIAKIAALPATPSKAVIQANIEHWQKQIAGFPNDLDTQIENAQAVNQYLIAKQQLDKVTLESDQLTQRLDTLRLQREQLIADTQFPVEGLGFGNHGITYNGLPFEQASSSEQLRIAMAISVAMNPKLRIILIRDGSLLDKASLENIAEMAANNQTQVWVEYVTDDNNGCGIFIEDGCIAKEVI